MENTVKVKKDEFIIKVTDAGKLKVYNPHTPFEFDNNALLLITMLIDKVNREMP